MGPFTAIDDKIKILRVVGRLNIGGPAIHVVNLAAGLDSARFQQWLAVGTEHPDEGSMMDYALSHGVQPLVIPEMVTAFRLTPRDATAVMKLCRLLRRLQPHIVHTHTTKAGFLGRLAANLTRIPVIVHTYHGHVLHKYYGATKTHLLRCLERTLAAFTDCLVTVSESVKQELVAYRVAPSAKITVIPLGFHLEPYLSARTKRGHFRQEIGVNDSTRLVGIVGRLFPIKNHRLFLDAAARVAACEPTVRFIIVGDGVLRSKLEQQAQTLGIADRVCFTGWRRDLPHIYADLDVLMVSSDNEGTPVSAIEAMAAGCPVVATRVGGLPDLITDRATGYLVPPNEPDTLADATMQILQQPDTAHHLSQAAQGMVRERFAVQRLILDIEALYYNLLTQKGIL
jgi:glycosyltransferase involved in cell wall biosynthesis